MLLKQKSSQILLEVLTPDKLIDPFQTVIEGQLYAGEELQDPEKFQKSSLSFPSDEPLPACWIDPDYRHLAFGAHRHEAAIAGSQW
ncbi:MAG: acetyltransferase [Cyanobacteria bacterium P01_F01_bin.53]